MFFKKKNIPDSKRVRRPDYPAAGAGATPVFSYHAQAPREPVTGMRRATRLLWSAQAADAKPSPRQDPRRAPKRVAAVAAVVLVVALVLNSIFLTRNPTIVVHSQADGSQLLLRSQDVYQEAARAVLAGSLANTNKITIDTGKVAAELQKQFPELGYVSVVLPVFGRQPVVRVQTVQPALVLASSRTGGVFLVDDSGRAVMEAAAVAASVKQKLPVVQDQSGLALSVGDSALPRGNVSFITEVVGQLSAKGLKVVSMVLPASSSELDVRIEGAPYTVKFNLRGDARVGVGAFLAVKQHLEREGKTPGSYIDVRVDNKAYYR